MATIVSLTDATLSPQDTETYIEEVGAAVTAGLELAPQFKSVYHIPLPAGSTTKKEKPEITFFIYTAPDKTVAQKRAVIANLKQATDRVFGPDAVGVVVIFKIHEDENVGVNGVLRLDAKRQAQG